MTQTLDSGRGDGAARTQMPTDPPARSSSHPSPGAVRVACAWQAVRFPSSADRGAFGSLHQHGNGEQKGRKEQHKTSDIKSKTGDEVKLLKKEMIPFTSKNLDQASS